jgi:hypothetical protein
MVPLDRRTVTKSRRGRTAPLSQVKANAQQVLRERAGVARRMLGVSVLRGNDARVHLKREVNARRVPRGAPTSSTRSIADEAPPPAWP